MVTAPENKNVRKFRKNKSVGLKSYGDLSFCNKSLKWRNITFETDNYGFRNKDDKDYDNIYLNNQVYN